MQIKRLLVTGGSGFLGKHLIEYLLRHNNNLKVRSLSRDENYIIGMKVMCEHENLEAVVGDIRDINTVKYALKEVDAVIHLAAMKHIDLCEQYPSEAVSTNVIGIKNLLQHFLEVN